MFHTLYHILTRIFLLERCHKLFHTINKLISFNRDINHLTHYLVIIHGLTFFLVDCFIFRLAFLLLNDLTVLLLDSV